MLRLSHLLKNEGGVSICGGDSIALSKEEQSEQLNLVMHFTQVTIIAAS